MNAAARAIAGDVDTTTVTISAPPPADSTRRKALAFGIMCLGCFMAYLDTQIVRFKRLAAACQQARTS